VDAAEKNMHGHSFRPMTGAVHQTTFFQTVYTIQVC